MNGKSLDIICSIVLGSVFIFACVYLFIEKPTIPLSDLINALRLQDKDTAYQHYLLMMMVRGSGGRLYHLSKDLSLECSRTIRASMLMDEQLAIFQDEDEAINEEFKAALQYVRNGGQLEEHPLEVYCRRIEKSLSANGKVSVAFEKAKKQAANLDFASRPHAREVLKTQYSMLNKSFELCAVPDFARIMASMSFTLQLHDKYSWRMHYFVKSCIAVAKSSQFAESMQSLYAKVLDETVPVIGAVDLRYKMDSAKEPGGYFWVPNMARTFYKYIAENANMKKELEKMAAIVGKDANKIDLDFSQL